MDKIPKNFVKKKKIPNFLRGSVTPQDSDILGLSLLITFSSLVLGL